MKRAHVEGRKAFFFERNGLELAIEVVCPSMLGTDDSSSVEIAVSFEQFGAAVPTDIEKCVALPIRHAER